MGFSGVRVNIKLDSDTLVMHGPGNKSSTGCILRGVLDIHIDKPTKIKSINLVFSGRRLTSWMVVVALVARANRVQYHHSIIHHRWKFINNSSQLLPAGDHAYDFELPLNGNLPTTNRIERFYYVDYQLEATIERPHFLSNYECQRNVYITRPEMDQHHSLDMPVSVNGEWRNKLYYTISIPSNVSHHGHVIPVKIDFSPLSGGIRLIHVDIVLKEYASCTPIKGHFGGKSVSHSHQVYTHSDVVYNHHCYDNTDITAWSFNFNIPLPKSQNELQYHTNSGGVHVHHQLKFFLRVQTTNHHSSHILSSVLPILIQPKPIKDCPPAYHLLAEDNDQSHPYDAAVMAKLLAPN